MAEADNSASSFGDTISDAIERPDTSFSSDGDTVTESKSWFQRVKEALVAVGLGLLLVTGSIAGLFWNEGRAIQTTRSLQEGGAIVVEAEAPRVDPAKEGKLVHVTGELRTMAPLRDQDFLVEAQAGHLLRKVEMYQWKEESRTETRKTLGRG